MLGWCHYLRPKAWDVTDRVTGNWLWMAQIWRQQPRTNRGLSTELIVGNKETTKNFRENSQNSYCAWHDHKSRMSPLTQTARYPLNLFLWWRAPQHMLWTHRSPEGYCAILRWRWLVFRVMEHRWIEIDREKPKYSGKKPVPVPLCSPQIPHRLRWDRTRASAVRGRRLTSWPAHLLNDIYQVRAFDKKGIFHYLVDGVAKGIIKLQ
jgi:hypothetical protein